MKTAYELFETFETNEMTQSILNKMLVTIEDDVMELALDEKGFTSIWLTAAGMESIIKEVNRKWNEVSDLFFEYCSVDIPKDMVMNHLRGSDEKRCKRLISNLKRRNEKGDGGKK